jgi:hypothetical protein
MPHAAFREQPQRKGPHRGPFLKTSAADRSALARLETRIALADHEYLAAATYDFAVTMALLCGLEGRQHFHGTPREGSWDTESAEL